MKNEFKHKLWAWVLLISLVYPIAVNFGHSLTKHNLPQPSALTQIDKAKTSCAVFHYIHNYNAPLKATNFDLKIPEYKIFHVEFLSFGFKNTTPNSVSLRAPPIC